MQSVILDGLKPVVMMIMVQVVFATTSILVKMVAQDGMTLSIFIAYRTICASSFLVPLAFFMERKSKPKITSRVLFQAFVCGLFGVTIQQNLFVEAVALATATYASAIFNLVPGVTFVFALGFRLEKLNIGTIIGKAKVVGTITGIGGAMILTFFKGSEIQIWSTHFNIMQNLQPRAHHVHTSPVLGSALAFACSLFYSMWLILQAMMGKNFPWRYTSVALMSIMASIQSIAFALCMERDWNQWKLCWNIRLFTILFAGIFTSGISFILIEWCVRWKGPLYASIFNPLFLVLVAIGGYLILNERLYLGSIIGSLLIVVGLYIVLWGKNKEQKSIAKLNLTKGIDEGEALKIMTIYRAHDEKSTGGENNDMK